MSISSGLIIYCRITFKASDAKLFIAAIYSAKPPLLLYRVVNKPLTEIKEKTG